jgi:hypothetical protein
MQNKLIFALWDGDSCDCMTAACPVIESQFNDLLAIMPLMLISCLHPLVCSCGLEKQAMKQPV